MALQRTKDCDTCGSLARWPFPAPILTPLGVPPCPLGPERAAFSGPPPPGTNRDLSLGLRGTRESLSALAQDTCIVHTQALTTFNTCWHPQSLALLPLHLASPPQCSQPRGPPAAPTLNAAGRPGARSLPCYLPSVLEEAPVGALSLWALAPYSQALSSCS